MSFKYTRLAGGRALVEGGNTSVTNQTIVSTSEYDQLIAELASEQANNLYDEAVKDFFAPLVAAAAALEQTDKQNELADPDFVIVTQEEVEGSPSQELKTRRLSKDTVILRLIDAGTTDRLIWIGDNLELTEYVAPEAEELIENPYAAPAE